MFDENSNVRYFQTVFLKEVEDFISCQNQDTIQKILYNVDLAEQTRDIRIFKKLQGEIWEFRVRTDKQIRLLAFWYRKENIKTLVVVTHAFVKKTSRVDVSEIRRAEKIRIKYLEQETHKK